MSSSYNRTIIKYTKYHNAPIFGCMTISLCRSIRMLIGAYTHYLETAISQLLDKIIHDAKIPLESFDTIRVGLCIWLHYAMPISTRRIRGVANTASMTNVHMPFIVLYLWCKLLINTWQKWDIICTNRRVWQNANRKQKARYHALYLNKATIKAF